MNSTELRQAFTGFFAARDHLVVPSASLVPHDASVMFTIAGMVPFKPYFLGEQRPPAPRVTTVQRCFRTLDIEVVGKTERHCTFFEMLGNFSFGDYFKQEAIPLAWELVTEVLGVDAERLWVTVHQSDAEAEEIWRDAVKVPAERIQRLGEENFWRMGEVGPCGPCSELYFDRGREHGPAGGPAHGGPDRFVEIWNLVFMQMDALSDGSMVELPRKSIDTGAGLERILPIVAGVSSIFDTDVLAPVIAAAEDVTGCRYGADHSTDVALRILADHSRAIAFLISDGVLPSNEGRGYVLRRVLRRMARRASQLGAGKPVSEPLLASVVRAMGSAYPQLARDADFVSGVATREEERFLRTLDTGAAMLSELLGSGKKEVPGEVAFRLHDTYGFPVELTTEIAAEHGVSVDLDGFSQSMEAQRSMSRSAAAAGAGSRTEQYREVLDQFGPTTFAGHSEDSLDARVLAVLDNSEAGEGLAEIFLDVTPFYAEGGGQVGDTGRISTSTGVATVIDTTSPLAGVICHRAVVDGAVRPGQIATASIDGERRAAIRRNHSATHLLHWALRTVLGDHVRQQGSLVAADHLRFDFSHPEALSHDQLLEVERIVNLEVLSGAEVRTTTMSREEATDAGALAFFGDKYGDVVRVVRAGSGSVELCGGTHVASLGMIGSVVIVSEGSIGSNVRRIEAVTGTASLALARGALDTLEEAARSLKAPPEEVLKALERLAERHRGLEREIRSLRQARIAAEASQLAAEASQMAGVAIARRDGFDADVLREIAIAVRAAEDCRGAVIAGTPDGRRVALVAAFAPGDGLDAAKVVSAAARVAGGGGGGTADLAVAGGKDPGRIDEALALAASQVAGVLGEAGGSARGDRRS